MYKIHESPFFNLNSLNRIHSRNEWSICYCADSMFENDFDCAT